MPVAPAVRAENLCYRYLPRGQASGVAALRGVSFDVRVGEFVGIVGPSGSGKSTLLQILSSLLAPDSGTVSYPGLNRIPRIGYLFQADAAFPWRTVEGNLTYALEIRRVAQAERRRRAEELCLLVGLDPTRHLQKYPRELSGGQLRRVGLGMALSDVPDLLLLDEPTSAVDWITRRQLQGMMQDVIARSGTTAIAVTHDIEEAVWLTDRVLALRDGLISESIEISLPRSRTDAMRTTEAFKVLENRVINALGPPPLDQQRTTAEVDRQ